MIRFPKIPYIPCILQNLLHLGEMWLRAVSSDTALLSALRIMALQPGCIAKSSSQ